MLMLCSFLVLVFVGVDVVAFAVFVYTHILYPADLTEDERRAAVPNPNFNNKNDVFVFVKEFMASPELSQPPMLALPCAEAAEMAVAPTGDDIICHRRCG